MNVQHRTSNIERRMKNKHPIPNVLKDERPTSNIERRTSNNDVARAAQALAPRAAPPVYKLAEYLIHHSMFDVHFLIKISAPFLQ